MCDLGPGVEKYLNWNRIKSPRTTWFTYENLIYEKGVTDNM